MAIIVYEGERGHSIFSASSSYRWINCPASLHLQNEFPDTSRQPPYIREGNEAHSQAADAFSGKPISDVYVRQYVDYVLSFYREDMTLRIETPVNYSTVAEDGFGTPDAILYSKKPAILNIFDFKFGYFRIDADDNHQLMLYAIGAIETFKMKAESIILHIVQPRINHISKWSCSIQRLFSFARDARESARLSGLKEKTFRFGTHCVFCNYKRFCSEYSEGKYVV